MLNETDRKEKLIAICNDAIKSGVYFDEDLDNIDYYAAVCRAAKSDSLFKFFGCNMAVFRYNFKEYESIMLLFAIPTAANVDSKEDGRHISQKVMDIIKILEEIFVVIDYMNLNTVKEDKFCYLTIVKKNDMNSESYCEEENVDVRSIFGFEKI
jgi:hypothetical protein